ncbi:MAG: hypothetical protein EAZ55_08925 [Cytophagales bacterium]|nr:MAG: hypothetical protein EAZ55_08925 [Cytophagales bacterium]
MEELSGILFYIIVGVIVLVFNLFGAKNKNQKTQNTTKKLNPTKPATDIKSLLDSIREQLPNEAQMAKQRDTKTKMSDVFTYDNKKTKEIYKNYELQVQEEEFTDKYGTYEVTNFDTQVAKLESMKPAKQAFEREEYSKNKKKVEELGVTTKSPFIKFLEEKDNLKKSFILSEVFKRKFE